jgi:uncharacterized membrane protein
VETLFVIGGCVSMLLNGAGTIVVWRLQRDMTALKLANAQMSGELATLRQVLGAVGFEVEPQESKA